MQIRGTMAGGILVCGIGAATSVYSALNYEIGELSNIGPGAFPIGLGVLLLLFGVSLVIQGLYESRYRFELNLGNVVYILLAVLCFALLIAPFGIFPAVTVGGAIAARADRSSSNLFCAMLGLSLAAICSFLFVILLELPVPAISWRL